MFGVFRIGKYVDWPPATLSRIFGNTTAAHTYIHIIIQHQCSLVLVHILLDSRILFAVR